GARVLKAGGFAFERRNLLPGRLEPLGRKHVRRAAHGTVRPAVRLVVTKRRAQQVGPMARPAGTTALDRRARGLGVAKLLDRSQDEIDVGTPEVRHLLQQANTGI